MLLFHGTTIDNMKKIIKNGFSNDSKIWNVSEDNMTYFFTEKYFTEYADCNSPTEILECGIHEAMDQSRIALAIQNPSDYRGAVLVFESNLMKNKDEIQADYSCPNMSEMAVCLENPDLNGLIGVYIMKESEAPLRLFQLATLWNRDYINLEEVILTDIEEHILKTMASSDIIHDIVCAELNETVVYQITEELINFTNNHKEAA